MPGDQLFRGDYLATKRKNDVSAGVPLLSKHSTNTAFTSPERSAVVQYPPKEDVASVSTWVQRLQPFTARMLWHGLLKPI